MEKRITKNALETQAFAKEIAHTLKNGDILALYGELGSGKTTFVQGLAKELGIDQRIVSPTFIIMRSYDKNFYHVDLYRTETGKDIEGLGLQEIMGDNDSIVVIEWPEKIEKLLPERTKRMYFTYRSDNEREIVYGY